MCRTEGTGNCSSESVTYAIRCLGDCQERNIYKGESSRNGYTRGLKHQSDLNSRNAKNSALWKHCRDVHRSTMQEFQMKVTGTFKNDAMLRQITEAVQIESTNPNNLMNTRAEWNMTRFPRAAIN